MRCRAILFVAFGVALVLLATMLCGWGPSAIDGDGRQAGAVGAVVSEGGIRGFGALLCALLASTTTVVVVACLLPLWRAARSTHACVRTLCLVRRPADGVLLSAAHGLVPSERLYCVSDDEPYAVCIGLARPVIYVSAGLISRLTPDALRAALAHEESHRRRRDALRLVLLQTAFATVLSDAWVSAVRMHAALRGEIVADRFAVSQVSSGALATALLAVLRPPGRADSGGPVLQRRSTVRPSNSSLSSPFDGSQSSGDGVALVERLRYLTLPPDAPLPAFVPQIAGRSLMLDLVTRKLWWVGVPAIALALVTLSPLLRVGLPAHAALGCVV